MNTPYKLTKNKPIKYEHFQEFLDLLPGKGLGDNSWTAPVSANVNYDLSAKNPVKQQQAERLSSAALLALMRAENLRVVG